MSFHNAQRREELELERAELWRKGRKAWKRFGYVLAILFFGIACHFSYYAGEFAGFDYCMNRRETTQ